MRVFSILLSAAAGMAPLGLAVAGPVVDRMGVQFWYLLAGAFALCSGMAGLLSPNLLQLEKKQENKSPLQNFQIHN